MKNNIKDLREQNSKKYIIEESKDSEFNLKDCFDNVFNQTNCFQKQGEGYFDGYSHFSIHEEMLKDRVRTSAYEDAIMKSPQLLKDKIVLDVGCGTGILSIFAVRAGAKHVYAVDNANIVHHTRNIIKMNGMESKITVIQGKIEEISLPVEKVDVIISEWMGYLLLYESMLDTVLYARDKWLSSEGELFPDRCAMFVSSIEDSEYREEKTEFWDNVYKVNMGCIKDLVIKEPLVDSFDPRQINSDASCIFDLYLKTALKKDLQFTNAYSLNITKNDHVHALVSWFDVYFSFTKNSPVILTTSPYQKLTHWKQVVFYLQQPLPVFKGDILKGSFALKKNEKHDRHLDIKISYNLKNQLVDSKQIQNYKLT